MAAFKVNITKNGNAIKFQFTDSDHYLYGNGEIEVPVNSLSLVIDESDFVTFKKASTNDTFITFNPANSNLSDKAGVINFYKTNMVGSTGGGGSESGITSGEVQTMIDNSLEDYYTDDEVDAALSGKASASDVTALENEVATKADTSAVTAVANDVSTVSGQVATKVAINDFNAYSATTDARIAEDEEVTAAALNNLDERIGDPYQKVSGITIEYNSDSQTPEVAMELEDEELGRVSNIFNKWGFDVYSEDEETGHQSSAYINNDGSMGVYEHSEGQEGNEDEGMSYDKQLDIHPDSLEFNTQTNGTDYEQSENVTISKDAITMYKNTNDNGDITESTIEINNNQGGGDGVFINLNDGSKALDLNTSNFDWTDGSDVRQINWGDIATLNDIDAAVSGKVDTSAITSSITSGSTDSEIPTAKATYDAIQAGGGGGATYSAGTNISIDTANTINCTLNLANGTGNNSIKAKGNSTAAGVLSFSFGDNTEAPKTYEIAFGIYNKTSYGDYLWGNSGNSFFTVGNGANGSNKHNAFEIRQNGDIYFSDTDNTTYAQYYRKPMVRLQDMYGALGGLKFVQCTQAEYDALVSGGTVDANTLYIINNVV